MSPAGNFTLHAILAACLAALAASSAAAGKPVIDNEGHAYLTIHLMGGNGAGNGQQLEVVSYQWGVAPSALKLDRNYVKSWSTSGDAAGSDPTSYGNWIADVERPAPKGGGQNELGMDDTAGKEKARQGHSMLGASERVTVGAGQTESGKFAGRGVDIAAVDGQAVNSGNSGRVTGLAVDPSDPSSGQATGKRQHKPFIARGVYDQADPPPSGSLTVLASGGSCRVGARYPSIALSGGGKNYVLQDVQVVDCGGSSAAGPEEQITFVYDKVRVRGWDPAKKQQ